MRTIIATILCTLAGAACSQELPQLAGRVVAEAEQDRTLISKAGWLRGLHVLGTDLPPLESPRIQAFMPAGKDVALVCARITSMAGDYSAMVQYDVPLDTDAGDPMVLTYEQRSDLALANTPLTGGVAVERGPCEGDNAATVGQTRDFYVNFWNQAGEPRRDEDGNATLILSINVSRADSLEAKARLADEEVAVPCVKLMNPTALAYNFECRLLMAPGVLEGKFGTVIEFEYERIYRGEPSRVRRANLHLGAPDS